MWTSSVATLLQQAIEWYSHTTVWKWPPSWDVTTEPSAGSNPERSCLIGSPHHRFRPETLDLIMWTPSPCWETPCTQPLGTQKTLARAYDHVYYEGREIGNLPRRGKKSIDQSATVYQAKYAQIVHWLSTLTRINCEKFVQPMLTSLVHPEMVYPNKRYKAYCLKVLESGPVAQYEPVSKYKMDGL